MEKRFSATISRLAFFFSFLLLSFLGAAQGIEGDAANGKTLFNANCASCHKLDKKAIGPALGGVTARRDIDWLYKWITNNQELRANGDALAVALFEEYNGSVMPAFPGLSEQDVNDILVYTESEPDQGKEVTTLPGGDGTFAEEDDDNTFVLLVLGSVLVFLIFLLARVKNTLKKVQNEPTSTLLEDVGYLTRAGAKNPRIVTVAILVVAVVLLQQFYVGLSAIGVTQEYQPEQPIKFSHKLHAGENQIECTYCHYGARKSMHSNIPSAGVCMNCHFSIQNGPNYGAEEINKIYAAVGFDPETSQYIEGYEQKPIKWVRIHDLPDLAYFNHSQHYTAGGIKCQTCHGPIQEMEEVYQYSPLTMGWCINCHRETEVQVESNEYYAEMHEALKKKYGKDATITVEMIGGLECGKCHY